MAETWDDRIVTDSQMADYWALHLQMVADLAHRMELDFLMGIPTGLN